MKPQEKLDADMLRRIETVYAGLRMIETETDEKPTLRKAVWRLLQEAIETQHSIKRPGPSVPVSAMPEVFHTAGEIFATEVEMAKDKISYPSRIKKTPSAAALTRYEEVMTWLRYIRGHNQPRSRRTVLMRAAGAAPSRVADILGYPSASAVEGVKRRAITGIMERLKRDLPGDVK